MGFLGKTIKAGIAAKALEIAKREAAKPENQRKAKELLSRVTSRRSSGSRPR